MPSRSRLVAIAAAVAVAAGAAGLVVVASGDDGRLPVWDVTSAEPEPCSTVEVARGTQVEGGCVAEVFGRRVRFSVLGAFGLVPFAECEVSFHVHIDHGGRAWVGDIRVTGPSPCNDVLKCATHPDGRAAPTEGSLDRAGGDGLRLTVDSLCLDTCVGRFEGDLRLALRPGDDGWRVRADRSTVGGSGWLVDGAMETLTPSFAVGERS